MSYLFFRILKSLIFTASIELCMMPSSLAHQGIDHSKLDVPKVKDLPKDSLASINASYVVSTKALLLKACGDCHSRFTKLPWYFELPFIGSIMTADITEAKKHLDLSDDFPFKGHGLPEEDLRALDEVLQKKTMPPVSYRLIHQSKALTDSEISTIRNWTASSLILLKARKL